MPRVVFEFVLTQLVLRSSGFKSSELTTVIKETDTKPVKSSVNIQIKRGEQAHGIAIGEISYSLTKTQASWSTWMSVAYKDIIRRYDEWEKKSVALRAMEDILESLEKIGFELKDSPIDETFDVVELH